MSLARLQAEFQSFVLEGRPQIADGIVGTPHVPVETRLAVYSDAYRLRLAEALESNFLILAQWLGADQFEELARGFIQRHRSVHFSIRWYGEQLPAWLLTQAPYSGQPLLAELARWEWSMTLAFDAADAPLLRRNALAGLSPHQWSELKLAWHPSVHSLRLHTPAPAVWRALSRGEPPPAQALSTNDHSFDAQGQQWVLWRRGLDTFFRSLEPVESTAFQAVSSGASFAEICETLAADLGEDNAAEHAALLLARWLEDEMLAA